jgi:hypothetical protein
MVQLVCPINFKLRIISLIQKEFTIWYRALITCHTAKLPEDFVPFLFGKALLRQGNASKYFREALDTMRWECNGHCKCVDDLSQDIFDGDPGAVTLFQLLDGYRFSTMDVVVKIGWAENCIDSVKQGLYRCSCIL